MKKLLAILLALSMVLSFAACGNDTSDDEESKKKKDKDNKTEQVGENDSTEGSIIDTMSDAEIKSKYEALEVFMEENQDVFEDFRSALSEIDGAEDVMENGVTDEFLDEVKNVSHDFFSKYFSDEDAELYSEMYCVILNFQVLVNQNPGFMESIFEAAMEEGYDIESEEFWEYVGEELKEYVPEWCIEPIVKPMFTAVTTNSRTKTCLANQREIRSQITNFILCEAYDRPMDQELEFYYYYGTPAYSLMGDGLVATEVESMFVEMPCCPSEGVVVVKIYNDGNGNYSVETGCRDNCDGTDHNM